ncbi:ornithine cyclodeaminase [Stutzerimonas stutzeri]|uniref:Ornithine cyclodeaminase n=1 Tax=Stutzerimonas stutzeri TaxID=316 RepID=W8QXP6_STUST|nr:ornithine cyclodeaminase family protein [Stutzerimonas stutzeri]AHL75415.1 ornithine cyclodeaminase [Stutzerimonas stutzeri]MCQ4328023.1 ornithine cyclodeaminase family protein [Stutzerimonas stutzeri]
MQLNAEQVRDALPWPSLIEALTDVFAREDVCSPVRHHHFMNVPGEPEATLLLMPAWIEGEYLGVKQVNVFPGNNSRHLPGLSSHYLLSCGKTGQPLGLFEGNELTARRTAAASALASRLLSRENANSLLMVGAGRMGRRLIPAHMSVRPINRIHVWDRNEAASRELVAELKAADIDAKVCRDDRLQHVAGEVDIISCATLATEPVILGDWLNPGVHLDLIGSFTPSMRETDNRALQRCDVFVDTRAGALSETGDLIIPINQGAFRPEAIVAELSELCRGQHAGRAALANPAEAMTIFKSVGDSREDLAAAILVHRNQR